MHFKRSTLLARGGMDCGRPRVAVEKYALLCTLLPLLTVMGYLDPLVGKQR